MKIERPHDELDGEKRATPIVDGPTETLAAQPGGSPEGAPPVERKFKNTPAYRALFKIGVVNEEGELNTKPSFVRLTKYGFDAHGKRYAQYAPVFRIQEINDYFVDMVRVDDSGEPGVSTDWNFGDTNASTWEGLELDVVTQKEWGRGYGEIKDRKVEDTKAYAALKKLGLVDDAGKLVRTPVYFKAPKQSERGEVVYRIQDLGPYYTHLTYVAKGVVISSGQAATNSGMWDMVIGEATEEEWAKGE